jgi:SAM-dependent methyltransferase
MQKGPGVDVVADAIALPFPDNSFDLVLCLETLEHCDEPWKVTSEIERVSKKNGGIILSSQQNFPLHMHPSDYFRFTPYGLSSLIKNKVSKVMMGISPPFDNEVELNPKHVIVIAWNGDLWDEAKLKKALKNGESRISGHKPYRHRVQDAWKIFKRALSELNYHHAIKFFR